MIPDDVLDELRVLNAASRKVVGNTRVSDPARIAGDAFCRLAAKTISEHGVSPGKLSLALGLSYQAVRRRLEKRGYYNLPASQLPYLGTGEPSRTRHHNTNPYRSQA